MVCTDFELELSLQSAAFGETESQKRKEALLNKSASGNQKR